MGDSAYGRYYQRTSNTENHPKSPQIFQSYLFIYVKGIEMLRQ